MHCVMHAGIAQPVIMRRVLHAALGKFMTEVLVDAFALGEQPDREGMQEGPWAAW